MPGMQGCAGANEAACQCGGCAGSTGVSEVFKKIENESALLDSGGSGTDRGCGMFYCKSGGEPEAFLVLYRGSRYYYGLFPCLCMDRRFQTQACQGAGSLERMHCPAGRDDTGRAVLFDGYWRNMVYANRLAGYLIVDRGRVGRCGVS